MVWVLQPAVYATGIYMWLWVQKLNSKRIILFQKGSADKATKKKIYLITSFKIKSIYSLQSLILSIFDVPSIYYNQLHHATRKEKTFSCKKHRMDCFDRFNTDRACCHLADILS